MTDPLGSIPQYPLWQAGSFGRLSEGGKPSSDPRTASTPVSSTTSASAPSANLSAFSGISGISGSQASDAITQAAKQGRRARSAKAKEQLEQLMKQYDKMRLLMVGGDPKALVRWAHDMAHQISDAAKDFAANAEPTDKAAASAGAPSVSADPEASPADNAPADGCASGAAKPDQGDASQVKNATQSGNVDQPASPPAAETPDEKAEHVKELVTAEKSKALAAAQAREITAQTAAADAKPVDSVAENAAKGSALFTALGGSDNSRSKEMVKERELFERAKNALRSLRGIVENEAKKQGQSSKSVTKDMDEADKNLESAIKTIGNHGEGQPMDTTTTSGPTVNLVA